MVNDIITFGGGSKRQKDPNGFLHVDDCVLTKAVVNEYMGSEIPKWDELGLNPNKIYRVLRDPAAIEASLAQMNGLPILDDHDERHDAETPQQHKRIGCIGTDGAFDGKEVRNRLTFWNKRDIDAIESGAKVCLSMGYDYEPVMQSGKHDGEAYDLKMADIVWNHIAHVEKGRVDGAVVADASGLAGMARRAFGKAMDAGEFKENDHPRRDDGKFGTGGGRTESKQSRLGGMIRAYREKIAKAEPEAKALQKESAAAYSQLKKAAKQDGVNLDAVNEMEAKAMSLKNQADFFAEHAGTVVSGRQRYDLTDKEKTKEKINAMRSESEELAGKARAEMGKSDRVAKLRELLDVADEKAEEAAAEVERMKDRIDNLQYRERHPEEFEHTASEDTAMSKIDRRIAPNHHATKDKSKNNLRAGAKDSANTKGKDMPKNKRTGDEEPEETAENRVIAGIKALAAEFDNVHKENGIDPGITDEETDTLKKVQDFLDSFANRGKDDEMAGTTADPMDEDLESMDEFPPKKKDGEEEAEDEEPPVHNANGKYEDAEKGKSPTGDKAMDADAILAQVRREFRMKEQALDEVAPLVGSVQKARAMDSALDVYRFALATHGVEIPKEANLSGLRGMVNMLKRSMQPAVRTGDSFKPTGAEARIADMIGKSPYAPRE